MDSYDRGEGAVRTHTLTDSAGTALDLSAFDEIVVKVIHKHLGTVLGRYSLGEGTVSKSDPTTDGEITYEVLPVTTADAALGLYQYQAKTRDYDGVPKRQVFSGDDFYLTKALT